MRSRTSRYPVQQSPVRVRRARTDHEQVGGESVTYVLLCIMFCVTAVLFAVLLAPVTAGAQEPAKKSSAQAPAGPPSIVQGYVLDSANKPISGAEVMISDARNKVLATAKSGEGGFFQFRVLKPGTYRFTARSLGFSNGKSKPMPLAPGDTLDLQFVLDGTAASNEIAAVSVVGGSKNPQYRITAAEIAKTADGDALDVVLNRRIRMLGDTYKGCMSDTSTFTRDFRYIRKPPKSMSSDSSMPLRLYINGRWYGVRGIKDVLSEIPAEDIAEINYVDCWDRERPNLRNTLLVVLKPGVRY